MQNSVPRKSRATVPAQPDNFATALDRLPGLPALAATLGLPESTVYAWRRRNSVPVVYWEPIVSYARAHGIRSITYSRFRQFEAERFIARQAKKQIGEAHQRNALPFAFKS